MTGSARGTTESAGGRGIVAGEVRRGVQGRAGRGINRPGERDPARL